MATFRNTTAKKECYSLLHACYNDGNMSNDELEQMSEDIRTNVIKMPRLVEIVTNSYCYEVSRWEK